MVCAHLSTSWPCVVEGSSPSRLIFYFNFYVLAKLFKRVSTPTDRGGQYFDQTFEVGRVLNFLGNGVISGS